MEIICLIQKYRNDRSKSAKIGLTSPDPIFCYNKIINIPLADIGIEKLFEGLGESTQKPVISE